MRAHPEWEGRPLVVSASAEPRAEILAVSPEAARLGIRPGASVVHGRALCAELRVRPASPDLERAARAALLDAALSTSPRAQPAPPASGPYAGEAAVFVDARGVEALFRSERGFAGALARRSREIGLPGAVAVAGSPGVARIAARGLAGREADVHVVPPGGDAAFLAPLSLDLLNPDDALADALTRFGLRRVGDLVRLPERALVTRLGAAVRPLLALARGEANAPPPAAPELGAFEEAFELETPVTHLEPFLFALRGGLSRLAARLACRGLAVGDLQLDLGLAEGGRDARRVGVAAPTLDLSVLLRLVSLSLEGHPPPAPVESVRLATAGCAPRSDQLDFFRPPGPAPAVLSRTLAELAALCGDGRVGAPAVADSHRPDAFGVTPFAPGGAPAREGRRPAFGVAIGGAPVLALRALRPPVPAQVRAPGGVPASVRSALAHGDVVRVAGPWRTTGHWWSEDERYAFDHYDAQISDGLVVRLRFDWIERRWQIDGLYD